MLAEVLSTDCEAGGAGEVGRHHGGVARVAAVVNFDAHPPQPFADAGADAGAWKVDGTTESEVVSRILGKAKFKPDTVRLHQPDMMELRRSLPNATFIVFLP